MHMVLYYTSNCLVAVFCVSARCSLVLIEVFEQVLIYTLRFCTGCPNCSNIYTLFSLYMTHLKSRTFTINIPFCILLQQRFIIITWTCARSDLIRKSDLLGTFIRSNMQYQNYETSNLKLIVYILLPNSQVIYPRAKASPNHLSIINRDKEAAKCLLSSRTLICAG